MRATTTYGFRNRAPEAVTQLAALEAYLDPLTIACLERLDLPAGARCLELGAGGGSIARWLADRTGVVVAVDKDTSRLASTPNVEVREHDLYHGPPGDGPYHVIHARLVLLHLANREKLLRQLVDQLAPDGWLVLGEFSRHPLRVLSSAAAADAELFTRVVEVFTRVLEQGHGVDLEWAHRVHPAMVEAGLVEIHSTEHAESWTGGGAGSRLHHVNSIQKEEALREAGVTDEELARFRELVADPAFSARSWQFVCTRGRRPPD